jgi:Lon protease-like protein
MQGGWLPLFPLEVVLFPGAPLPLHIFEDRYKEMIADVMAGKTEFGIVLAREKGILNVGCTATVEQVVKRYDDGRMDIFVTGRRRFEIIVLSEEKSYLQAQIQLFDDEDTAVAPMETRESALNSCRELRALLEEAAPDPALTDPRLSFEIARSLPDLDFRQVLLRSKSEAERITMLAEHLPGYVSRLRYVTQAKQLAPRNGHAKKAKID